MSPKIQPDSLEKGCYKKLTFSLINALIDEENIESIREYLSCAPYVVLETLLKEILKSSDLEENIRFNSLQMLLREDVKSLETDMFPKFYHKRILEIILERGLRLQNLNLKGLWARDCPKLLCDLISNLNELKCLEIPHIADDSVIKSLNNLKYLNVLNISGDAYYSEEGLKAFKNESLVVLDIGNYGNKDLGFGVETSISLVAALIENLPNLAVLKTYSFAGHALQLLHRKNPDFVTKLTYVYDTDTTLDVFDAIVATCPKLNYAYFHTPCEGVVEQFHRLKDLHTLKLTQGNTNELIKYLSQSQNKLEVLKINHNKLDALDIGLLARYAENLKTLECYYMNLEFPNLDKLTFRYLSKIQLIYCDISDKDVMSLMVSTPEAISIHIGSSVDFTDEDILRLVTEHNFPQLEELIFSYASNLTDLSVELLVTTCWNLKVLGTLSEWNISELEFITLKLLFQSTNTDVTLLPLLKIY
ncbi:uncharacterized protein LOC115882043 [Sitophilus oryzae]|uniref:Uncharacterized protein LOC115882043 n=1 Tax=Sitophilus oryzae TaxID=7048 RepID=A0A6J2XW47_SITOR|nr:uncharacterized protein LOC115882043 [Sitophilus oryzae]XP_030755724.1 uncharacterized protein LOC115882043 [Sitophilus oryzae]